ncbi:MAG: hypothetical protein CMJ58_17065 [Planctomycetaceae bacterium]|nr:hypothetical protein [Planctomycetaceae bacterium]
MPKTPTSDRPLRRASLKVLAAGVAACAVGWWGFEQIESWYRQRRADRLTVAALRAAEGRAAPAIGRLPELGTAGVERLAWLATEPRPDLAEPARDELDQRLQAWMLAWRESGDADTIVEPLTHTVRVLRVRAGLLPAGDIRWCESFSLRALELSEGLPPRPAAALIADCEAILQTLPRRSQRPHEADPALTGGPTGLVAPTIQLDIITAAQSPPRQSQPWQPSDASAPAPAAQPQLLIASPPNTAGAAVTNSAPLAPATPIEPPLVAEDADSGVPALPRRNEPMAAGPRESRQASNRLVSVPTPLEVREQRRLLRKAPTELLLRELPQADRYQAAAIRRELAERNVPASSVEDAQPAGDGVGPTPVTLSERVARLPAAEGRRVLRELAESADADPATRLEALTLLATLRDPELAAIARRRAVHDADPRVAARASEILQSQRR